MAVLNELVTQIENPDLRARIAAEVENLAKQKKFGLVFEEHLPECTPLWDIPVKKGSKAALKSGLVSDFYTVLNIEDGVATCLNKDKSATTEFHVDELVSIAEFGEPIYPYLKPMDTVCNAPDSDLWHTLIEADNYHALQLLEYLYAGKVDCIYIDPPYNTGARDWKYNNDYVDGADQYRHSKWLSMMQKRLKIAKKLLKKTGMLITTIDDNEYADLYLLIEELFPECFNTTISIQMNPGGTQGKSFSVTNEFAIVTCFKDTLVCKKKHLNGDTYNLRRWGSTSNRYEGATCFYPIILDGNNNIIGFGDVLPDDIHPSAQVEVQPDGTKYVWPFDVQNTEKKWRYARDTVESVRNRMFIEEHGSRIEVLLRRETEPPKTVWVDGKYNAEAYGTKLIKEIIGKDKFSYPKSLYATADCLALGVSDNPDALILDFFAGSGTTLHAVNLLNAIDGGKRRCIIVTNNEVSEVEAKNLRRKGVFPGDEEWEALGIARHVTWPRTVCSIKGIDIMGKPLKGTYGTYHESFVPDEIRGTYRKRILPDDPVITDMKQADGFRANAVYFKLGFLDKNAVALGRQFKEMLPTLWMKAGAVGPCPSIGDEAPGMLILPENRFAELLDEKQYLGFEEKLNAQPEIETAFIVTDSESGYRDMIAGLKVKERYQLYRDYLDNFRINSYRR